MSEKEWIYLAYAFVATLILGVRIGDDGGLTNWRGSLANLIFSVFWPLFVFGSFMCLLTNKILDWVGPS